MNVGDLWMFEVDVVDMVYIDEVDCSNPVESLVQAMLVQHVCAVRGEMSPQLSTAGGICLRSSVA